MSGNTSATGGYLRPLAPVLDGDALDDALQAVVVGVTGLAGSLVRPRFQPKPPPAPAEDVDWCAIGVLRQAPDWDAAVTHDGAGEGQDVLTRSRRVEVLATFYGPMGADFAGILQDGLSVGQNLEGLRSLGIEVLEVGEVIHAGEAINQRYRRRHDLRLVLRRAVARTYPVLNITSAAGEIITPEVTQPFTVEP